LYTAGEVIETFTLNDKFCDLKIKLFDKLEEATPFQFAMVGIPGEFELPLYVSMYDHSSSTLELFFKITGRYTEKICFSRGYVHIRGFYGKNRLDLISGNRVAYIAEEWGFSPLPLFATWMKKNNLFLNTILIFTDEWSFHNVAKYIEGITHTSAFRFMKSNINELLEFIAKYSNEYKWESIVAAGDRGLLKSVCRLASNLGMKGIGVPYARIKCALGACGYCTIPRTNHLFCTEGPLFTCEELAPYLG
jgi:NAD(P)H-flavin reductase